MTSEQLVDVGMAVQGAVDALHRMAKDSDLIHPQSGRVALDLKHSRTGVVAKVVVYDGYDHTVGGKFFLPNDADWQGLEITLRWNMRELCIAMMELRQQRERVRGRIHSEDQRGVSSGDDGRREEGVRPSG